MCNRNTTKDTNIPILPNKPTKTHLYFDLLSLPRSSIPHSDHLRSLSGEFSGDPVFTEAKALTSLALPILLTNLILYSRSMCSVLFLGRLGGSALAGGSLAVAFANITGYSVLSGLALGMEPLCSQAFGAARPRLLSVTLHRAVLFLLLCSIPISLFWVHVSSALAHLTPLDPTITGLAHTYLVFSLPDLLTYSFLHPIKIYLRAQNITRPVTLASLFGTAVNLPLLFLFKHLNFGIAGPAVASAFSNLCALAFLISYVYITGTHKPTWTNPSKECLKGWAPLVKMAAPSCMAVCLEWWWYEIMIVLCGLLANPTKTVASMGVLIQTTGLIYNFPASLSHAVSTRVGNHLGAGKPHTAKLTAALSLFIAAVMGVISAAFAAMARHKWARIFTSDAEILSLTAAALPILGLCEVGNCPQTVACGVVRGSARPSTAANVNLGAFYMVGLPVAVGVGFYIGVGFCGLWIGLLAAQICCAGLMLYVVGSTDWEMQAKRAQRLTCTAAVDALLLDGEDQSKSDSVDQNEPLICIVMTSEKQ